MNVIPLTVNSALYGKSTIFIWKTVWEKICVMAYENKDICEEIITLPGRINIDGVISDRMDEIEHTKYYTKKIPNNDYDITFDSTWKRISKHYGALYTLYDVPDLKKLHVPRQLFDSLGVRQFFRHSFPNCKITYWEE